MSKKLAEGLDGLLLDVKTGSGAQMKTLDSSRELAHTMVAIGKSYGVRTVALITSMDQPLGKEVGNANEIRESIEVLEGNGPDDVIELTLAFGEVMLELAGIEGGRDRLQEAIDSGAALQKFIDVTVAQGGDPSVIEDTSLLAMASEEAVVEAPRSGVVTKCDALTIGLASTHLGAGRESKEDQIDLGVGVTIEAKLGDHVKEGQVLARVAYSDEARWEAQREFLASAWAIGYTDPEIAPLVLERIE